MAILTLWITLAIGIKSTLGSIYIVWSQMFYTRTLSWQSVLQSFLQNLGALTDSSCASSLECHGCLLDLVRFEATGLRCYVYCLGWVQVSLAVFRLLVPQKLCATCQNPMSPPSLRLLLAGQQKRCEHQFTGVAEKNPWPSPHWQADLHFGALTLSTQALRCSRNADLRMAT